MSSISDLFNHFMSLVGINYYNKTESDTNYASKNHSHTGYVDKSQGSTNKNKNVVTDSSGNITVEAKPTIPTKTSDLTNDSGFLTQHQDLTNYVQKSEDEGLLKNDGTVDTAAKAPKSHAATGTTYGVGTTTKYGHCMTINDLTLSAHANGKALSAYQGKVLKDAVDGKADSSHTHSKSEITDFPTSMTPTTHTHSKSEITDFPSSMTPTSHTHGNISNDGKIGSASGKIITTGTSGALQASDSITKSQISDFPSSMTPSSHTHGDISNDGKVGSTANLPLITTTGGKVTTGSFGNSANTFCQGNDSRLSDSRTPTSHTHGNLQNNGQVGSTAAANKNVVTDSNGKITTEDKPTIPSASTTTPSADTASGSVGTGTTWARSNHTHPKSSLYAEAEHTHSQYLTSHQDISGKVDKESGKGLSTNDFTTTYKEALDNLNTTIANAVSNLEMIEVVTELPTTNIKTNRIYLKANTTQGSENKYDVYVRVNNAWEKIDSLDFSISDYIKKVANNTNIVLADGTNIAQSTFLTSHQDISGKLNIAQTSHKGKNVVVDSTSGNITFEDKPTIPDVSGKIDTAGSGLSKSGTTLNHSNSITAVTSAAFKKFKYDAQGHITGVADVGASDLPSHTHNYTTSSDVDTKISTHNSSNSAHSDIRNSIPTDVSDLNDENDIIFGNLESKYDSEGRNLNEVAFSGSYTDLDDKPTIPAAYTHPTEKQCSYAYTHPSSKQCNATIPTGSSTATDIKMNGSQSAGSSSNFAKADHVHPSDTSRVAVAQGSGNSGKFLKVNSSGNVACESVTIPEAYTHPSEKQCDYAYSHPSSKQCSHTHGNLTDDGKVGSNANYFIVTGTGGAITNQQKIGNITTSGAIGSTSGLPIITTTSGKLTTGSFGSTSGKLTTGSFGSTSGTFCQGNDSRLHSHTFTYSGGTLTIS